MDIKAIIFDVDGVLLQVPHYFTQELQNRGYENAAEIMSVYYKNENVLCAEWKAKSTEHISPYLEKIWWNKWVEEYFNKQFQFESQYLKASLITLIPKLRNLGIKCYLWTDQEEKRAMFLLDWLDFKNILDGYFISCYVWFRKCFPQFWDHVKETLWKQGIQKEEIVFFDDLQNNLDTANKQWIQAFLFTDSEQFYKDLKALDIHI